MRVTEVGIGQSLDRLLTGGPVDTGADLFVIGADGSLVSASPSALARIGQSWAEASGIPVRRILERLRGAAIEEVPLAGGLRVLRVAASARERPAFDAVQRLVHGHPQPAAIVWGKQLLGVNPALVAQLGYTSDRAFFDRDAPSVLDWAGDGTAQMRCSDATLLRVEVTCVPIKLEERDVDVLFFQDVGSSVEIEARLRDMSRMIAVGTTAAGVAHEVNNPLTYVGANLLYVRQVLEQVWFNSPEASVDAIPAENVDALLRALLETEAGVGRIRTIVDDLRLLSRPTDSDDFGGVDVVPVLEMAIRMAIVTNRETCDLRRDYQSIRPVIGNMTRLGQVFLNLMVNAVDALQSDAATGRQITISTRDVGPNVEVVVADQGGGMEPAVLERAFDAFFTTKAEGVGTGLGLAISKQLVQACGGRLEISSDPATGVSCRVVLRASSEPAPEAARVRSNCPIRSGRILVIDTDPLICTGVRRLVDPVHRLEAAVTVEHALTLVATRGPFDLVLCELAQQRSTGASALNAIRQSGYGGPVVFMIAGLPSAETKAFLDAADATCLEKPFDAQQLNDLLIAYLGLSDPGD